MNPENCDPVTGACEPAAFTAPTTNITPNPDLELIYVGDPMCSWCWGLAPILEQLKEKYAPQGIVLRTVVGGLRPGGGDPWNQQMKDMLKHHWEAVHERSGQPFGYGLMDLEDFEYNTEPSCRAVVASRQWLSTNDLDFFKAIQYKFYVLSEDPGEDEFYKSICKEFNIPFEKFLIVFHSKECKQVTEEEFVMNRNWGIQGYPTVVVRKKQELFMVANGFASFDQMDKTIATILNDESL